MDIQFDVTLLLIGLTCACSVYAWSSTELYEKWVMAPYFVHRRGEWYRFLTSGFLHADVPHLAFNMIAFWSFAPSVRAYFDEHYGTSLGLGLFLLLYLSGIVVSDLPTYFKHRHSPNYLSLGASGGVSSVMFASILFQPLGQIGIAFLPDDFALPSFVFGFLYLIYSYYQGKRMGDNINHDAHLYGALYGILFTLVTVPMSAVYFWQQISAKYL